MDPTDVTILVVDDMVVDRLFIRRLVEKHDGWRVVQAADGAEALEMIARAAPAAILTDLQMPVMDGLALVEQVRERFPRVPVVLMTGHGSEEIAIAALRAGAANYVPKCNLNRDLLSTLEQVLAASQTDERRTRVLSALSERSSRYTLENDPALVGPLVQVFREEMAAFGLCDATGATRAGIAMEEAVLNAIYHGNLGVSSDLKLAGDGSFERTAAERRLVAPYSDRRVCVTTRMTAERATFVIADEGPGFDVAALPDPTDPANLELPSGRGVLFMRTFMDDVKYNPIGNEVTLVKLRESSAVTALVAAAV